MKKNLFLALALAAVATFTGCTTGSLVQNASRNHVVQVSGKVLTGGIGLNAMTGQDTLGYQSGYVTVTTIPVVTAVNTNGQVVMVTPDVATAFEVSGKNTLFGSAGSSYRLVTGQNGMNTLLANSPPINEGFYGTNNTLVYQLPNYVTTNGLTSATGPLAAQTAANAASSLASSNLYVLPISLPAGTVVLPR